MDIHFLLMGSFCSNADKPRVEFILLHWQTVQSLSDLQQQSLLLTEKRKPLKKKSFEPFTQFPAFQKVNVFLSPLCYTVLHYEVVNKHVCFASFLSLSPLGP